MGHTLVARWEKGSFSQIEYLMKSITQYQYIKIPYGRNCNRYTADKILPWHITVSHWGKNKDSLYLSKVDSLVFMPFEVLVNQPKIFSAEEGSSILMLPVQPAAGYDIFCSGLCQSGIHSSMFLHITLAVSKNPEKIRFLCRQIIREVSFPFPIHICGLELYHIWDPVKLVRSWIPEGNIILPGLEE